MVIKSFDELEPDTTAVEEEIAEIRQSTEHLRVSVREMHASLVQLREHVERMGEQLNVHSAQLNMLVESSFMRTLEQQNLHDLILNSEVTAERGETVRMPMKASSFECPQMNAQFEEWLQKHEVVACFRFNSDLTVVHVWIEYRRHPAAKPTEIVRESFEMVPDSNGCISYSS